jgi:hypothetical protein
MIEITPPQVHINFEVSSRAGILPSSTVAAPGAHGAGVTGTQGMGVRTPAAADVALATAGLASEVHMPKGMILTIGTLSIILAAGILLVIVWFFGSKVNVDGANPKEHCSIAPRQTCMGIINSLLF